MTIAADPTATYAKTAEPRTFIWTAKHPKSQFGAGVRKNNRPNPNAMVRKATIAPRSKRPAASPVRHKSINELIDA